jgi:hypothetical protein
MSHSRHIGTSPYIVCIIVMLVNFEICCLKYWPVSEILNPFWFGLCGCSCYYLGLRCLTIGGPLGIGLGEPCVRAWLSAYSGHHRFLSSFPVWIHNFFFVCKFFRYLFCLPVECEVFCRLRSVPRYPFVPAILFTVLQDPRAFAVRSFVLGISVGDIEVLNVLSYRIRN